MCVRQRQFRRRTLSPLLLLTLCVLAAACSPDSEGDPAQHHAGDQPKAPSDLAAFDDETTRDPSQQQAWDELEALGYLAVGDDEIIPGDALVRIYDPAHAYHGPTHFTSGHAPKAFLIGMDGRILHEWEYVLPTVVDPKRRFWRRMHLFENGDALAIFEGRGGGIAKIDALSNEIWALSNNAHHDLQVMNDGSIYLLTRTIEIDPKVHRRLPIHHDRVTKLSAGGEVLAQWSILDALRDTIWESEISYRDRGDLFHVNTLEVLDGSHTGGHPAFQQGRFLLSFRVTNALAVMDPVLGKIVWYEKGPWKSQHQPSLLANGNILLFNNYGSQKQGVQKQGLPKERARGAAKSDGGASERGPSEILEYDPVAQEVVWRYAGTPGEKKFYSGAAGSVARLPNGNLLASLSFQGRAVEITRAGRIVWEYRAPFEIEGKVPNTPEYVRHPADFPLDWIPAKRGE